MITFEEALAAQSKLVQRRDLWEAGMNGIGIGVGPSLHVWFERGPIPELPAEIDGVPVHAEVGGPIKAL